MRKLFLFVVLTILTVALCLPVPANAASIGGAETVGKGKFSVSVNQDIIFGRDGTYTGGMGAPLENLEMNSDVEVNRTMVKGSYGLASWWEVYVTVGRSSFNSVLNWSSTIFGEKSTGKFNLKGDNGLAYGFGTKVAKEFGDWILGGDLQYLRHKNSFNGALNMGGDFDEISLGGDASFGEFQVAPYVARKFGDIVPYLGVKYSNAKTTYNLKWEEGGTDSLDFSSAKNIGMFLGTDWKLNDSWKANLEGSLGNEKAIGFAVAYKF